MNLIIVVIKKEFYKSIYREHGDYDVFAYKIQTGPRGFEPLAYWLRASRSTWLSYGPNISV